MEAYAAALSDAPVVLIGAKRTTPGTVEEAVARYLGSAAFVTLAPSTRSMRRRILEKLRVEHGDKRLRKLEAVHVGRLLGKLPPWEQRNWLKTLRGLISYCQSDGLIDHDPTQGVRLSKVKNSDG